MTASRFTRCWPLVVAVALGSVSAGCSRDASRDDAAVEASNSEPQSPPTRKPRVKPSARAAVPPTGPLPRFREVANEVGIHFERYDDQRGQHRIVEVNGGGVAIFDYDLNGRPDVFLTDGCRLPASERDGTRTNHLFRQTAELGFSDETEPAGLRMEGFWHGVTTGDFDSDGFDDLYVTAYGRNQLWRNRGDGTFAEANEALPPTPEVWSSSAAFCDLNRDGVIDLYVVTYLDASVDPPVLCPRAEAPDGYVQCSPSLFEAVPDVVFEGNGSGGFKDITVDGGFTKEDGKGLGVVVFDADRDGRPDVYVANDGTPNFLYMNQAGDEASGGTSPRFVEQAFERGAAVNRAGEPESGMGVLAGDATGDGWSDIFLTHFFAQTNTFYRNDKGIFSDHTFESGLGPPSRQMLGFGTEFIDFDLDGQLDIFVANGHIDDFSFADAAEAYAMPPQFFRNQAGHFTEVSRWSGDYFLKAWIGRGAATGDLDADGDLDLVVSHQRSASAVLLNESETANKCVLLRLVGVESNRSAFGAVVECEGLSQVVVRERVGGGGFQSASEASLQIGLGSAGRLTKATVRWPSGATDQLSDLEPGSYIVVEGRRPLPIR